MKALTKRIVWEKGPEDGIEEKLIDLGRGGMIALTPGKPKDVAKSIATFLIKNYKQIKELKVEEVVKEESKKDEEVLEEDISLADTKGNNAKKKSQKK